MAIFGQLYESTFKCFVWTTPKQIELGVSAVLLEKERAMVGGANFGHAPRDENLQYWNTDAIPDGGMPTPFHKSLVVTPDGSRVYSQDEVV